METLTLDPNNRVYASIPNFDWNDAEQKTIIKDFDIEVSPIIKNFGKHGCMMCPFRVADYYQTLRGKMPHLYDAMVELKKVSGKTDRGEMYSYLYQPFKTVQRGGKKVQVEISKEEAWAKDPTNFYRRDPMEAPTEDNLEPIF